MLQNQEAEVYAAGTFTYEDYKKHNNYHQKKMVISFAIFAFLIGMIVFPLNMSGSWIIIIPIFFVVSLIISAIGTLFLIGLLRLRVRREFKSDQLIKNEIRYSITNEGINQQVKRSNSHLEWSDFISAFEHKDMFRLYISKHKAIVLPKRYFASKEDRISFKQIIETNMPSKKVKWT